MGSPFDRRHVLPAAARRPPHRGGIQDRSRRAGGCETMNGTARGRGRVWAFVALGLVALSLAALGASGQITYSSGQNVAPVFEGWEENPDGTFTMVFGYF